MTDAAPTPEERARRLRHLLALEIQRMVEHLAQREAFIVQVWSRYRSREPLLDTIFSRWSTVGSDDLVGLDPDALVAVQAFYDEVDALRMYARFTEDMPTTLQERLEGWRKRLTPLAATAVEALGGAPARPTVGVPAPVLRLEPAPAPSAASADDA